jgi:hypothetical protein
MSERWGFFNRNSETFQPYFTASEEQDKFVTWAVLLGPAAASALLPTVYSGFDP